MTFPTDAGRATFSSPSFNTSHAVTLPGSISAGNLLIMWVATSSTAVNTPSGWTALGPDPADGASFYASAALSFVCRCFYKIASGSEGATQTVTTPGSIGISTVTWRITGHDPDWRPELLWSGGTGGTPDPPNLDPYGWEGPLDVLWLAAAGADNTSISGTPTNYSNVAGSGPGGAAVSARGSSRQLNAVSENPGSYTATGNVAAATIAIKPVDDADVDHSPEDYGTGTPWHTTANANSHPVPMPQDYASGELGILGLTFDINAGTPTVTTPTGWTALSGSPVTNGRCKSYYWWRILDGSEGSAVTVTTSGGGVGGVPSAGWIRRVKGHDAAVPPEFTSATGSGTSLDPPSHSTSWGTTADSLFIASVGQFVGTAITALSGTPSGYEKTHNCPAARNVSNACAMRSASKEATASSENPAAFTSSTSQVWVAVTIAVKGGSGGMPQPYIDVFVD